LELANWSDANVISILWILHKAKSSFDQSPSAIVKIRGCAKFQRERRSRMRGMPISEDLPKPTVWGDMGRG
jgi:hypothetical protein